MRPAAALLWLVVAAAAGAQEADSLRITHKFSWRRWVDQTYVGFVYGSVSGSWKVSPAADGRVVDARYYVVQESRRDNTAFEKAVDAQRTARFRVTDQGQMTDVSGEGVPVYRNYPVPLPAQAGPGAVWTAPGALAGDFLSDGRFTVLPILVEYRYQGEGDYLGTPVVQVTAQYALRYRSGQDAAGDPDLSAVEGTRKAVISYSRASGDLVFLRETAEQTARPVSGPTVKNLGFVYTVFDRVPALGTAVLAQRFRDEIAGKPATAPQSATPPSAATPAPTTLTPPPAPGAGAPAMSAQPAAPVAPAAPPAERPPVDQAAGLGAGAPPVRLPAGGAPELAEVKVEADPRGVKLTLQNLRFVADQAALLPGEEKRLASIAALLLSVPDRPILVVGHTADLGRAASQDQLSVDRALAVVNQLKKAGVPAGRILYQGRGGREPLAANDTEAQRAQNRRVEILVLDQ